MLGGWLVAVGMALSPGQCTTCGPSGGMEFSPGMASGSWSAGGGGMYPTYDAVASGGGGGGDQMYPFDSPEPWLHGYFQEMPAYGGHNTFRPHNYKHVLAQMQQASSWGINPAMAYSHQWYHPYRQRSGMHPNIGTQHGSIRQPTYQNVAQAPVQRMSPQPQMSALQQAAAVQRGYPGPAIPGITTPYYQMPARRNTVQPASTEYVEALEKLREQMQQQSFQMQTMQQQLETSNMRQAHREQPWAQPNNRQFAEQPQQPAYQELPPASAQQAYPGQGQQTQAPAYRSSNISEAAQPITQPAIINSPATPQQVQPYAYPNQAYPNYPTQNQSQPIMQLPASQAYFSTQQASPEMMAQAYNGQNSQAMWQQQLPANQPQAFNPYANAAPIQSQQYPQQQQFPGQVQQQYPVQQFQQYQGQAQQYQTQPQYQQQPQQTMQPQYQYSAPQLQNDGYSQQNVQPVNGYTQPMYGQQNYAQPAYSAGY